MSDSALLRANAIEGLLQAPGRARTVLRAGLADANAGVRFTAVMGVGRLNVAGSTPLVRPLLNDPDPRVRAGAMFALRRLGERVDLSPLAVLLEHRDPRVRSEAARALGEIGNPSAAPMLRAAAARAPVSGGGSAMPMAQLLFRIQVAEALVKLGNREESDAIRAALYPSSREGFEVAVLAAQILGQIRDEKAIAQLVELIEQRVPGTPTSPDPRTDQFLQPPELRLAAARSLAQMGHPGGLYVAQMYADSPDAVIRGQVAFVLAEAGGPEQIEVLEKMLSDGSPLVQISSAAALLRLLDRMGG